MVELDVVMVHRLGIALDTLRRHVPVARAYLFGSQVTGTADRWSDIDLAVFVPGVEQWTLEEEAALAGEVQQAAGNDMELHLFPAAALRHRDPASFAAWVIKHGVEIGPGAAIDPQALTPAPSLGERARAVA